GADRADDVLGGVGDAQGEVAGVGAARRAGRGQAAHDLPAPAAGQVHVEQDDVGAVGADRGHRLVDVPGLGDDVHRRTDLGAHAGAEHRVVVDEDDATPGGAGGGRGHGLS